MDMVFFVTRDGKQIDEHPKHEFHAKLLSGDIVTTDYYWVDGMADWRPVSEYTVAMQTTMKLDTMPSAAPAPATAAAKNAGANSGRFGKLASWLRKRR